MLNGLLSADQIRFAGFGEVSVYALIGFLVVFAGIAFLILVVWLVGKFMSRGKEKAPVKTSTKEETKHEDAVSESIAVADIGEEELSEETVAVIMAAIMAYYEKNNPKCEFTVKRIKKIRMM
ncbi:MAG: OadG family protein [Clostridia bacterium]|nr:OadG family protein [Clostridia bacterium]